MIEKLKFVFGMVENIVGNIFSYTHNVFKRFLIQGHKELSNVINDILLGIVHYSCALNLSLQEHASYIKENMYMIVYVNNGIRSSIVHIL